MGRRDEIATCVGLLGEAGRRLVTVTGPGGTGKTRLALEVLRGVSSAVHVKAVFVDLTALDDSDQVLPAVARAVGLSDSGGPQTLEAVAEWIGEQDVVLLLDNFEQVLAAGREVAELLGRCPRLSVLSTSRQRLGVQGEHEIRLDPLPVVDPRTGLASDAVSLFADRASALSPTFALTAENTSAIIEICDRLDGLPLAIELAAARTKVLTLEELAQRLQKRLALLTHGSHDRPARHRTLSATIEWSYDLLTDDERWLLSSVAVFVDGWSLEAVERVCGARLGDDLLDCLGSLVDKSLVRTWFGSDGARFSQLVTIREFCEARLSPEQAEELSARHAQYFLEFAGRVERELQREGGSAWQRRWAIEYGNLMAALSWLLAAQDERALDLLAGMWRPWIVGGRAHEGQVVAEDALARLPRSDSRAWAIAALGLSELYRHQGKLSEAWEMKQEVLPLLRRHTPIAASATLSDLGYVADKLGRHDEAKRLHAEAMEIAEGLAHPGLVTHTLSGWADHHLAVEDLAAARATYEQVIDEAGRLGETELVMSGLIGSAEVARRVGDHSEARAGYLQTLGLAAERGDVTFLIDALVGIAALATAEERDHVAVRLVGAVSRMCDEGGHVPSYRDEREWSLEEARRRRGADLVAVELASGRALSLEELLRLAAEDGTRPPPSDYG